jgi:hypothetical protein
MHPITTGRGEWLATRDDTEQRGQAGVRRDLAAFMNVLDYFLIALQLAVAVVILSVWTLRRGRATPFRGGNAKNLGEEFAAYGLPFWFMCVVGVLKMGLALALIVAIWLHPMAAPAAVGMGLLMLGALVMHLKVRDPLTKSLPAAAVLAMCAAIALF